MSCEFRIERVLPSSVIPGAGAVDPSIVMNDRPRIPKRLWRWMVPPRANPIRWLFPLVSASRNVPGPESAREVTFTEDPLFPLGVEKPNPSNPARSEVENIRVSRIAIQADRFIQGFFRSFRAWLTPCLIIWVKSMRKIGF
jgi:hypothetical protein